MTENKRYNRREMINVVIHTLKGNLQILKTPRRKTLPRKYILNPIAPEPYIILVSQEVRKLSTEKKGKGSRQKKKMEQAWASCAKLRLRYSLKLD